MGFDGTVHRVHVSSGEKYYIVVVYVLVLDIHLCVYVVCNKGYTLSFLRLCPRSISIILSTACWVLQSIVRCGLSLSCSQL